MMARKPLLRQIYDRIAVLKLGVGRAIPGPRCQSCLRDLARHIHQIWTAAVSPHSPARINPGRECPSEKDAELRWTTGSAVMPLGKADHDHSLEMQEVFDITSFTLDEVLQVICESWERGLKDSTRFQVLINRMKKLLAEGAGREVAERKALEDAERVQMMVDSDREDGGSPSISWGGSSDASSTADSEYTVRSIRSFKERTSYFFRPCHNRGR